jgi:hypothetical protein
MPYQRLNEEKCEIWVIALLNDGLDVVFYVYLDNSLVYRALPYVRGNAEGKKTILVNGKGTSITLNLEAALRQLQHGYHCMI